MSVVWGDPGDGRKPEERYRDQFFASPLPPPQRPPATPKLDLGGVLFCIAVAICVGIGWWSLILAWQSGGMQ